MDTNDIDHGDTLPQQQPVIIETIDKYGRTILRNERGHLLPGQKFGTPITSESAPAMHRAYREKTARLLRQELAERGRRSQKLQLPENAGPAHVIAAAGGQLFDEIVLNPDAVARYRLDAWREIGAAAELLGDRREKQPENGVNVSIGADLAREIVAKLLQNRPRDE